MHKDDYDPKGFVDADTLQLQAVEETTISGPVMPFGAKVTIGINWECNCGAKHVSVYERSESGSYQVRCDICGKKYFVDAYSMN